MKKYFILFICLIGLLFSSCVEREDPYSWSIGQMEIDEPTPEKTVTTIPNIEDTTILQTKCMSSRMLILVQLPNNPNSKYDFWKDETKEHYAIIGIIYTDADHHKVDGKVYCNLDDALLIFNSGHVKETE